MRLDAMLWSFILFVMVVLTGSYILIDSVNTYDIDYDNSTFGDVYDLSDDLYDLTEGQKEQILGGEIDEEDTLDSGVEGASKAFRLLTASPRHIGNILDDIAIELGVNNMYITFFKIGFLVSLIFAVAYLFFRIRSF